MGWIEPRLTFGGDRYGPDIQFGGRFGYDMRLETRAPVAVFFDADVRVHPKPVRVPASETFSYQFHEGRWAYGPGVLARMPFGKFSPLAAGGVYYTDGVYWGSNRPPADGFVGWAEGGFQWAWNEWASWGLSWQYLPLPETSSGRLMLRFGFRFE